MIRLFLPASAAEQFVRSAARWQQVFKQDVAVILKQQAKSIITNSQRTGVMDLTPPTAGASAVGSLSEQRKAGEAAVSRDIRKVFMTAKEAVKKAKEDNPRAGRVFSRLLREKKTQEAMAILRFGGGEQVVAIKAHNRKGGVIVTGYTQKRISPSFKSLSGMTSIQAYPDPSLHRRSRDSRGRVNRNRPAAIVTDPASLTAYIKSRQAMVGYHKSGWRASAAAVGASVAAFISRLAGPGRVINNLAQAGPKFGITFINETVGIARHNLSLSIAARALNFASARIDRAVRGYLRRTQKL